MQQAYHESRLQYAQLSKSRSNLRKRALPTLPPPTVVPPNFSANNPRELRVNITSQMFYRLTNDPRH